MSDWKQNREARQSAYSQKLRDPRWQRLRLEVMQRDDFCCQSCFDSTSTLNVHHLYYETGKEPWEYPMEGLVTLCEFCHESESADRPNEEKALLSALRRRGFSSGDLSVLTMGFSSFPDMPSAPMDLAAFIAFALEDRDTLMIMRERYYDFLKQQRLEKEAAGAAQPGDSDAVG